MKFIVSGKPIPKARPRFANGHTYTPATTLAHEAKIRSAFLDSNGKSLTGALAVSIRAVMPIPKSYTKKHLQSLLWHVGRPDGDNLAKAVLDALNKVAYADDSQVAKLEIVKIYGDVPRTEIEIKKLETLL